MSKNVSPRVFRTHSLAIKYLNMIENTYIILNTASFVLGLVTRRLYLQLLLILFRNFCTIEINLQEVTSTYIYLRGIAHRRKFVLPVRHSSGSLILNGHKTFLLLSSGQVWPQLNSSYYFANTNNLLCRSVSSGGGIIRIKYVLS